ncbi:MAG: DUF3575 domain-containing protein [Bacteroidales bacterium]
MKLFRNKTHCSSLVMIHIFCALFLFSVLPSHAQKDTVFKNTVRYNITNPLIFGTHSYQFGYERLIGKNQSFSVNIGSASFPILTYNSTDTTIGLLTKDYEDRGFHISGDYRFYLKKENKYPAPRGIYIGPFYSYNYFNRINSWNLNSDSYQGSVQSDISLNIHTIGFELGYQFVFWNRLSVDLLLMGPGLGFYGIDTKLNTTLSPEDENLFFEALNSILSEKIPGYDRIIGSNEFNKSGSVRTADVGFRYMVMVGFRF